MYSTILVPVDLDDDHSWRKPVPTAVALCRAFGAKLHVVTVAPEFGLPSVAAYFPPDYEEKVHHELGGRLRELVAAQVPAEIGATPHLVHGAPYHGILAAAKGVGADLIVMGAHRPELSDYLIGPNAARVVRHADCSVMVVRE